MVWLQPESLDEALAVLQHDNAIIIAGGTDIYPAHVERPLSGPLVDISQIAELAGIIKKPDHWRIGAGVTWSQLINTPLPPAFDALKQAGREVGSLQIQNRATIIGNICNASPAADGIPPLVVLDADIELASQKAKRTIALKDFITGNRQTQMRSDEVVTAVIVPAHAVKGQSAFSKLGARKHLVISIAMVAARLVSGPDETVSSLAVSVGSCAPTPQRLAALEQQATGCPLNNLPDLPQPIHFAGLSPISDVRASAEYRLVGACETTRRLLTLLVEQVT